MKKMLSIFALSAFIVSGMTGCGGDAPAPKKDDKKAATPAAPTGGKVAAKEAPKKQSLSCFNLRVDWLDSNRPFLFVLNVILEG